MQNKTGQDDGAEDPDKHLRSVGYQVMLDKLLPRERGSILYCTTGIVLKRMQRDPHLKDISHLVLDEVHERQAFSDFAMALARRLLRARPDLRLILMSATMKFEGLMQYFAEFEPRLIEVEGKLHKVEERYLEDVLTELAPFKMDLKHCRSREDFKREVLPRMQNPEFDHKYDYNVVKQVLEGRTEDTNIGLIGELIRHIHSTKAEGGILVFVQGEGPMWKLESELDRLELIDCLEVHWLHSRHAMEDQKAVQYPPEGGKRKLVVATNIAEASITIPDIVYVIDTGKVNNKYYDSEGKADGLQTEWVSKSSADQRKGRAGRVRPGICYRLFTRARFEVLAQENAPDTKRMRLEEQALDIKRLRLGGVEGFLAELMDPPSEVLVTSTVQYLKDIGAFDPAENLTVLGLRMSEMPVEPQLAKILLIGSVLGCLEPLAEIVSAISNKSPIMPMREKASDKGKGKKMRELKKEFRKKCRQWDGEDQSDLLLLLKASQLYKKHLADMGQGGEDLYQPEFEEYRDILNLKVLKDNCKLENQLVEDFRNRGFRQAECQLRDNCNLIKAALCYGLWPNVGIPNTILTSGSWMHPRTEIKVEVKVRKDVDVEIAHRSVNADGSFLAERPQILVFWDMHLELNGRGRVLNDTTVVPQLAMALLGVRIDGVRVVYPESVYARFEEEVGKAIEFRLKNPGKWGARDTILIGALQRCLANLRREEQDDDAVIRGLFSDILSGAAAVLGRLG